MNKTKRLYRLCSKEEIEAYKQGGTARYSFGGSLFMYTDRLNVSGNCGTTGTIIDLELLRPDYGDDEENTPQEEKWRESLIRAVFEVPDDIPLSARDVNEIKQIFERFSRFRFKGPETRIYNSSFVGPDEYNFILRYCLRQFPNVYLETIRLAGFYENPRYIDRFLSASQEEVGDKQVIVIDYPEILQMQKNDREPFCHYFGGEGGETYAKFSEMNFDGQVAFLKQSAYYGYGIYGRDTLTEYLIPTYKIEPEHIVDVLDYDSDTFNKIKADYKEW